MLKENIWYNKLKNMIPIELRVADSTATPDDSAMELE